MGQYRRRGTVVAGVEWQPERAVGIERVEPLVLQCVGAELVREPDAASLMAA
jgi:hypothetical protein